MAAEIASMTGTPFETAPNKFTAQGTLDRMVRAHARVVDPVALTRPGSADIPSGPGKS